MKFSKPRNLIHGAFIVLIVGLPLISSAQQRYCGPMDVAFIIDSTGSMVNAFAALRREIPLINNQIVAASRGDYRLALVTYDDIVEVRLPLALNNRAELEQAVNDVIPDGGGQSGSGALDEALRTVTDGLLQRPGQIGDFAPPFNPSRLRIEILIADDLPSSFDDAFDPTVHPARTHQRGIEARNRGIKIAAVHVPTHLFFSDFPDLDRTNAVRAILQDLAAVTNGMYTETQPDATGVANALRAIIHNCGGGGIITVPYDDLTCIACGDVHYQTPAGDKFDEHGSDRRVLAISRTSGLRIETETVPWQNKSNVSVNKRVAVRLEKAKVILGRSAPYVEIDPGPWLMTIDGDLHTLAEVNFYAPDDFSGRLQLTEKMFVHTKPDDGSGYTVREVRILGVSSADNQAHLMGFYSVNGDHAINVAIKYRQGESITGFGGEFPPARGLVRDGNGQAISVDQLKTGLVTLNAYAASWSSAYHGNSLFNDAAPQPVEQKEIVTVDPAALIAARDTCAQSLGFEVGIPDIKLIRGAASDLLEQCAFDKGHTGDELFMHAARITGQRLGIIRQQPPAID